MYRRILFTALALTWAASVSPDLPAASPETGAQVTPAADPSAKAWQIIDGAMAGNVDQRRMIVDAASLGGARPKVFEYLGRAAVDKDHEVRMAVCTSLASLKSPDSILLLKKLLADPIIEIGFCAAQALYSLDDPLGKEALLEVLEGQKKTGAGFFSAEKREAMGAFKTKKRFFAFLFRMGIRFAPVPGLAMGVSSMQALSKDPGVSGRSLSALAFATGRDSETREALVGALKDKDAVVRASAVHALALRNDPSVKAALIPLLDDKEDKVRYRAAVAYLRLEKVEEEAKAAESQPATGSSPKESPRKNSGR